MEWYPYDFFGRMAETADMDDDNATSSKHGNEAFCELHAGQCVCGLKINKLIGRLYQSSLMHILHVKKKGIREIKYYCI